MHTETELLEYLEKASPLTYYNQDAQADIEYLEGLLGETQAELEEAKSIVREDIYEGVMGEEVSFNDIDCDLQSEYIKLLSREMYKIVVEIGNTHNIELDKYI